MEVSLKATQEQIKTVLATMASYASFSSCYVRKQLINTELGFVNYSIPWCFDNKDGDSIESYALRLTQAHEKGFEIGYCSCEGAIISIKGDIITFKGRRHQISFSEVLQDCRESALLSLADALEGWQETTSAPDRHPCDLIRSEWVKDWQDGALKAIARNCERKAHEHKKQFDSDLRKRAVSSLKKSKVKSLAKIVMR
jgi:hypothetical protein